MGGWCCGGERGLVGWWRQKREGEEGEGRVVLVLMSEEGVGRV